MQRSAEGVSTLTYPSVTVEGLTYIQVGQMTEGEVHLYALRDPRQTAGLLDINARTGQVQQAEISVPEGSMACGAAPIRCTPCRPTARRCTP